MIYGWIIAIGLLLGGAWLLKHEVAKNGELQNQVKHLEGVIEDTQEAVTFQQNLNVIGQQRSKQAQDSARRNRQEADKWRDEYAKLFSGDSDENTRWGNAPLPRDVAFSLCRADGFTDKECSDQMASKSERGVSVPSETQPLRTNDKATTRRSGRMEKRP